MWTPARGAAALVAELGEDEALTCLSRLVAGEVPPSELTRPPWPKVIEHIGVGRELEWDITRPSLGYWPRAWAARALAYVGDETVTGWLVAALDDDHWRVRMTAAQALGRIGTIGSEAALRAILADPHPRVRGAAVSSLGRTGDATYAPALEPLLDDESDLVRERARVALKRLGRD